MSECQNERLDKIKGFLGYIDQHQVTVCSTGSGVVHAGVKNEKMDKVEGFVEPLDYDQLALKVSSAVVLCMALS